jgi:membrane protein YdbS with pleckstrin-like domain
MELGELWKKLDSDKLSQPVLGAVHIQKRSKHPVQKLKNTFMASTLLAVVFLFCFMALFFFFPEWVVKAGIGVVIVIYVVFVYLNFKAYSKIKVGVLMDQNLKSALQNTHDFITENIRFQERFSLFVYPLCGAAGMLMGLAMGAGEAQKALDKSIVLVLLVVIPLLLTPPCYFLAKWMHKISYGTCLDELKNRIEELERPD